MSPRAGAASASASAARRDAAILRTFAARIDPADAGAHNDLGVVYFRRGMIAEAVALLSRALELAPGWTVARRNLEIAYHNTGYYERRVAALREQLRGAPADREARWELARAYALLDQTADAAAECDALLQSHAGDVPALLLRARLAGDAGDAAAAASWLAEAQRVAPGDPAVQQAMAGAPMPPPTAAPAPDGPHLSLAQYDPGRYAAAAAVALHAPLASHDAATADGELHLALGTAFRQQGYLAEAMRELRLALAAGVARDRGLAALGELHLLRREPGEARRVFDELLAEAPTSARWWSDRGVALQQADDADGAAASYARALALVPDYAPAHNNLGVLRAGRGDADGACAAFRAALSAEPALEAAQLNLGRQLARMRQSAAALDAYRSVLAQVPDHAAAWTGIGHVLASVGRQAEARTAFERAIAARPDDAEAHFALSFTLSRLGDVEGALHTTRRALELEPYYVPPGFALAIGAAGGEAMTIDLPLPSEEVEVVAAPPAMVGRPAAAAVAATAGPSGVIGRLQRDPRDAGALHELALSLLALGRPAEARVAVERLLRAAPAHVEGWALAADLAMARGGYRDAVAAWERVLALAPAGALRTRARREHRSARDLLHVRGGG